MLREDLKDSEVPHRTTIRKRIMEVWDEQLDTLQDQMKVYLSSVSYSLCDPLFSAVSWENILHHRLVE